MVLLSEFFCEDDFRITESGVVVVCRNQHLSDRKAAAVVAADFRSQRRGNLHHLAL
jgi:hypothetical protein